jgi:hypothetical protein
MFLEIGKKYILYFEIAERQLTYSATIIEFDDKFVKFRDRNNQVFSLAFDKLKQIREIEE